MGAAFLQRDQPVLVAPDHQSGDGQLVVFDLDRCAGVEALSLRLEIVHAPDVEGIHHVNLLSADPDATLDWYAKQFGGERDRLMGKLDGLRFGI